jgi:hypothetical protein
MKSEFERRVLLLGVRRLARTTPIPPEKSFPRLQGYDRAAGLPRHTLRLFRVHEQLASKDAEIAKKTEALR